MAKHLLIAALFMAVSGAALAQNPASDNTVVVGNPSQPVQWEHKESIQTAILKAGPKGTVWIPANYSGNDCNPISSCNPGTTVIIDLRNGGGLGGGSTNPLSSTGPFTIGPNGGISAILFNGPDPFGLCNPLQYDQLTDLVDPATGSSSLALNTNCLVNQRVFTTAFQGVPYLQGNVWAFSQASGLPIVAAGTTIDPATGVLTSNSISTNSATIGSLTAQFSITAVNSGLVLPVSSTNICCSTPEGSMWLLDPSLHGVPHIVTYDGNGYDVYLTNNDNPCDMANGCIGTGQTVQNIDTSLINPNINDAQGNSLTFNGGFPAVMTIAKGTASMTTAAILTGACGTTVTTAATSTLTTDTMSVARNAAPTIGYGGGLWH